MKKAYLLFVPFAVGLILMIYSWFLSFPLSINSISDSIFAHVPYTYWLSVSLLLTSAFAIAATFNNAYLKWAMTVSFLLVLYSLSYFYYTMPTGDSAFFRGLTTNLIQTNNLNASQYIHNYYQWPSFFLLGSITTLVSGLSLIDYEFILFSIIGLLMVTSLYVYASKTDNRYGFVAVMAFFVVMFLYLNYQAVPFSLAFALLLILFMLETRERTAGITFLTLILYATLVITHAFVPLFFVIYLLIRSIISKSRQYFELFILTTVIYVVVQITLAVFSFKGNIASIFTPPSEYTSIAGATFASTSTVIDEIPRLLTRSITIVFAILCIAGFLYLLIKRKMPESSLAIFITGAAYSGVGAVLAVLGLRAVPLLFIPVSLGILLFFQKVTKKAFKYIMIVILILVVFIPIHSTIVNSYPITFQTREDITTSNFMIDTYNWHPYSVIISDIPARWYIAPQVSGNAQIDNSAEHRYSLTNITKYDAIIYSVGLAEKLNISGISEDNASRSIMSEFNIAYNSGYSYIAIKNK